MTTDIRDQLQRTLSGAYTLERELGGGGMSRVFVAEESALGRKVVVKVLSPELAAGVSAERFAREVKLAARLQHANIVPVLTAGDTGALPFYTMPFVEGQSLRKRLAPGPLPVAEVITILRDVTRALAYAHEHGVVHRDIKPDNVLLAGGAAVVTDFGIAKAISAARTDAHTAMPTLTQVGTSIGTPAYMAPEQVAGDPLTDHRADIYALGAVAYELLAGRPPFVERDARRLLTAQMSERPQHVAELRPDTPAALAELVMKSLEKDPAARPQSASEMLRALDSVTSGGGLPVMPPILIGGPAMFRKALGYYAVAFAIVLLVAQAAVIAIGLPDWVLPGATVVMLMGLPVILFTGYVQRVTRRALTMTPTYTPGGTPSVPQGTMATIAMKASPHVSWRRTAKGGVITVGAFAFLVAAFMSLRALGIGPAGSLFAAGKLTRNEQILVADFAAKGNADTSLGGVVGEALRTDLGQSNVVRIVNPGAIRDALQRMQRPGNSRIDLTLAREIALREGIKAIIAGDITPLGSGFIVTARLTASENGAELASFQQIADAPKELITAVERLSRALRGKIGESLKAVRATPALGSVSTPSLDALRKYAEGSRALDMEVDAPKAIGLLNEAVALDTAFAMAWRKLSVAYSNSGFAERRDSAITRAYQYRERLIEDERQFVTAYYYSTVGRDRAKAAQAYEAIIARGWPGAENNLALIYIGRREFARAESLLRRRVEAPDAIYVEHTNLASALFRQGKIAEAESISTLIATRFATRPGAGLEPVLFLYHRGQLDSLIRLWQRYRTDRSLQVRAGALNNLAAMEQLRGRVASSLRTRLEARAADSARGIPVAPLGPVLDSARYDVWYREQPHRAVGRIDAALVRTPLRSLPANRRPYFAVATAYAVGGRADKARAILAQYDADIRDTTLRRSQQPAVHGTLAEIALAERRPLDAVTEFRASNIRPDGSDDACEVCDAADFSRAFDQADLPDSARVYMEQFIASFTPGRWNADAIYLPGILKRLGELYEARGEREKAYASYARFVDLWKNAEPELQPRVAEVRRRMARLSDVERR